MSGPSKTGVDLYREYQAVFQLNARDLEQKKPRRAYRRSLLGCLNCKKKKIKCDETKSQCRNCLKSHLKCAWPEKKQAHADKDLMRPQSGLATREKEPLSSEHVFQEPRSQMDTHFLSVFIHSFLPTLAQVNFQDKRQCLELVLAAAKESPLLQEVFIACGASIIAFNNEQHRHMAQERYTKAINFYLAELKLGKIQGGEVWFFVAVQVLQILCLRDMFADSNATRCAAHFGAAHKIISLRLSSDRNNISSQKPFLMLEKIMLENFLFNYSITIFFCDHKQLPELVPSPFVFFHAARTKLVHIFYDSIDRYKYRSMLAFQIAAKCAWLCRLKLPLDEDGRFLHMEIMQLAEALLLSFENEAEEYCHLNVKATMSIAKVVLNTSLILLLKITDFDSVRARDLQHLVKAIRADIDQPHNSNTILPIWSLMIAASTSLDPDDQAFFKKCLGDLLVRSKSKIIVQILNYLDGLWELYEGEEPFEFMFDTTVLDQVCN
ncbi:hypothetical protein METBIDRAFT_41492 [Metschnikowia bicuspidata var. bicuspidata NRRL YB-4993]|uniref:Zn(2)-C6 fungal-type domain-containing protein n=1 Tax=Metschnikowia bicuspidata var. bicuspidata NRRL YB-4993 TaxID=869754 RepID=A0A1A0HAI5_9ASCO|nr:hypothetical protein METBIDRAFT_41492 [Metschnikowia bicuspidata var. bicuspidata NRRL YB-4993]OBA20887.1 hypothetical protein METBIDRAFT_41492 [Metschnikowia bicuspidata var. bicuspidata NRRL YB-4993]